MPEFIDISPLICPEVAVWPGDVAFSRQVALDMQTGDNLTLSSITTTLHVGAHCDAPNHYAKEGASIAQRDLEPYYGPCQIVTVNVGRGERIVPNHITVEITAARVLFKTLTFPDPNDFNEDFASLSPEVVEFLFEKGVQLVGLDTPSVDLCHDRELLSHNAIAKRDLSILEGVVLDHVDDGVYTLIALPLKLAQADASPVRAVLVRT
jgi:arylformamidase